MLGKLDGKAADTAGAGLNHDRLSGAKRCFPVQRLVGRESGRRHRRSLHMGQSFRYRRNHICTRGRKFRKSAICRHTSVIIHFITYGPIGYVRADSIDYSGNVQARHVGEGPFRERRAH